MRRNAFLGALAIACLTAALAHADRGFAANLSGAQQVPPNGSGGSGRGFVILDSAETHVTVLMNFQRLGGPATSAQLRQAPAGVNGALLFTLVAPPATSGEITPQSFTVSPQQVSTLKAGQWYFQLSTSALPAGELRGQLAPARTFTSALQGSQQVPPNGSTGSGHGVVVLNEPKTTAAVILRFAGLGGDATDVAIHGPAPAGSNASAIFHFSAPGASSGSITPDLVALTAGQAAELEGGLYYFDVHSTAFPGGELRGQLSLARYFLAALNGAQEVPPNGSGGTAVGTVALENFATTITAFVRFSGLQGNATATVVHGPAGPGSTAPGLFDLPTPAATSGAAGPASFAVTPAQVADLQNGLHYLDLHSTAFPGGELRGQLDSSVVPVELLSFSVQ